MKSLHEEQPVIWVHLLAECDAGLWQQVFFGIEEEGIPFQLKPLTGADVREAAYLAAQQSPLLVGLACDQEQIVIHYKNLLPATPLFQLSKPLTQSVDALRSLGNNAARLVKGLPFKPL
jgi:hypothetical protein